MATNYWDYVRVGDLLALQDGLENESAPPSNDEVVFITVHQVFELWFKLVLRELVSLRDLLNRKRVPETELSGAADNLGRVVRIFRAATKHFEVVESLNTRDYLDFRDKLFPASGFQSPQLREIEIVLGLPEEDRIGLGEGSKWLDALKDHRGEDAPAYQAVLARLDGGPSVKDAMYEWLYRTPIRGVAAGAAGDDASVDAFLDDYLAAHEAASRRLVETIGESGSIPAAALDRRYREEVDQARAFFLVEDRRRRRVRAAMLFIESYRELPLLAWPRAVLAGLIEVEQAMIIWRQRHARMVERVIGRRIGTGGSTGVDYLDSTATHYRVFRELWAIRTFQLRAADLPKLEDPTPYQFAERFGTP